MKNKINKSDFSTRKTLENIKLNNWLSFHLSKNIQALAINNSTFEKWDTITIKHIDLKEETEDKTHNILFSVTNKNWKNIELNMSWWIFLKTFIEEIDPQFIIFKTKEKIDKIIK